jgi:hypothetical protein
VAANIPRTIVGWERTLCDHFLKSHDADFSPIRSFEISRSTLAESCGGDPIADAEAALNAFTAAFNTWSTTEALEKGRYRRLDREALPGCFGYLALTLLVDGSLDEDLVDLGAFRTKLAQFLGSERRFSNLSGVAQMWRDLKAWLDADKYREAGYRSLELPRVPPAWTHIGLTLGLSFPSRRDKRMMASFLEENPNSVADPQRLLSEFRKIAEGPRSSFGMKEAFDEFQHDYFAGRRTLASHRFWIFVRGVAAGQAVTSTSEEIDLQLVSNQDEEWSYILDGSSAAVQSRSYPPTLAAAVAGAKRFEPHQLSSAIGKGYLLFRQVGRATWRATGDISECKGKILVGVQTQLADRVGDRLGALEQGQGWQLTSDPQPVAIVEAALTRLLGRIGASETIVGVSVRDGIKNGADWLGRPRFLPVIFADSNEIEISAERGAHGRIDCHEDPKVPGRHRLDARETVEGFYLLSPKVSKGQRPPWVRRISFIADAYVHDRAHSRKQNPTIKEWKSEEYSNKVVRSIQPYWNAEKLESDDLIEAVYAGGRSGWDEADIVSMLLRWKSWNPWDVLRWLQDSKVIVPTTRTQWRGRIWELVPPTLIRWPSHAGDTVLVDGCVPSRLISDFLRAVAGERGTVFREIAPSKSALPIFGCLIGRTDLIASRLGWNIAEPTSLGTSRLDFELTIRRPMGYILANSWNWELGRFGRPRHKQDEAVGLARWSHSGGRDHDIYVVARHDESWHFLSRNAAIGAAHCIAGISLFNFEDNRLKRIRKEGALPDAVAAALRYSTLSNPEMSGSDRSYAYPAYPANLGSIASMLPNLVSGLKDSAGVGETEAVNSAQHSGGRLRVVWTAGRLSTTHSP